MVIAILPKAIDDNGDFWVQLPDHSSSHTVGLHDWGAHWLVYHVCDFALFDPVFPVACAVPLAVPPTAQALVHSKVTAMRNTACAALQTQPCCDAVVPSRFWRAVQQPSGCHVVGCMNHRGQRMSRLEAKEGLKAGPSQRLWVASTQYKTPPWLVFKVWEDSA